MFFASSRKSMSAVIAISIALSVFASDVALSKTPKPTKAQIKAAKAVEDAKTEAAKRAAGQLKIATKALNQLTAVAQEAQA